MNNNIMILDYIVNFFCKMSHMSLSEFMFEASANFSYDVHNFSCVVKLTKGNNLSHLDPLSIKESNHVH